MLRGSRLLSLSQRLHGGYWYRKSRNVCESYWQTASVDEVECRIKALVVICRGMVFVPGEQRVQCSIPGCSAADRSGTTGFLHTHSPLLACAPSCHPTPLDKGLVWS